MDDGDRSFDGLDDVGGCDLCGITGKPVAASRTLYAFDQARGLKKAEELGHIVGGDLLAVGDGLAGYGALVATLG
jgi:hypothetical protein